jgi:hypothetical protein
MKKAIRKARGGKRAGSGRKPTGTDPARTVRLSDEFIASVDEWAAQQPDEPARSEAIRRLVELGLTVKTKLIRRTASSADRAKELAAKAIDNLVDPAAPADEKASRKRRLLKGPEEFHDVRVGRAEKK